jgi:hypothetical protein
MVKSHMKRSYSSIQEKAHPLPFVPAEIPPPSTHQFPLSHPHNFTAPELLPVPLNVSKEERKRDLIN